MARPPDPPEDHAIDFVPTARTTTLALEMLPHEQNNAFHDSAPVCGSGGTEKAKSWIILTVNTRFR